MLCSEPKKRAHVLKGETRFACPSDEDQAPLIVFGVKPVSARAAGRLRQNANAFVVANGLDIHLGSLGQRAEFGYLCREVVAELEQGSADCGSVATAATSFQDECRGGLAALTKSPRPRAVGKRIERQQYVIDWYSKRLAHVAIQDMVSRQYIRPARTL